MLNPSCTWRDALNMSLALATFGLICVRTLAAQSVPAAQVVSGPLELPKGPAKPGFEITRSTPRTTAHSSPSTRGRRSC
jgi:hypothetical protein